VAYNGKLYIQTDKKLYCFGKKGENKGQYYNACPTAPLVSSHG
jgi:hypothetical protein